MELAPGILLAVGVIHLVRKTLDTARLTPAWDKVLSKIWLVSIVYFFVTLLPFLGFLKE